MNTTNKKSRTAGFTFIELLIASLVFTLAVAGLLQSVFGTLYLMETGRDTSTAVFHLSAVMERMAATPFNSLASSFPNGLDDGPAANRYSAITGGLTLRGEHITVTYPSPGSDPLEMTAAVRWQDSRNRPYTVSMSTIRTR